MSDVRDFNRLIRAGTPVLGIYHDQGQWVTGRLQRMRRHRSGIAWEAQPWGQTSWRELKSYRQVWVDRMGEEA